MEEFLIKQYTTNELFDLLDQYMMKYYKYYNSQNIEDRSDCIEYTKIVHEVLTMNFNYLKIVDLMDDFIDKHLEMTSDIDFVIIAIDYLLRDDLFIFLLKLNIDMSDDTIKSKHHYSMTLLIMNRESLYKKYIEEHLDEIEMKKYFLETKMPSILKIVKNIYDDMCLKSVKDEYYILYKNNLMELLCDFDLEEIYAVELLQ
jgi:hypothetical protein